MVGVMSTILHHKHPTSVTENLALKSLLLTTLGAPGSIQRLENQLGAGFSRQTSNAMLSNLISDTGNVVREWKSRCERLWGDGVSQAERKKSSYSVAPSYVLGGDNVGKARNSC